MVLDSLIQTLGEADNLAFLLLMTETILSGYRDATASSLEESKRLRTVVRCQSTPSPRAVP
jgi:hypothetical protein